MKKTLGAIATLSMLLSAPFAFAQQGGLYSIGQNMNRGEDFERSIPLTFTIGGGGGWDSNLNTSAVDAQESFYINGGIGVMYGLVRTKTTSLNVGAQYGVVHYFEDAPFVDKQTFNNARGSFDFFHRVSPKLNISNNFYLAYEIEPDYLVGASAARRNDQYLYGYNNLGVSYSWTRQLSTVTNYTISGVDYDEGIDSVTENRLEQQVGNQFRYMLNRQTTATAAYRFMHTSYDSLDRKIDSHFVTAGFDHVFSPYFSTSIAAGAQFYRDSVGGNETGPYAEALFDYRAGENTTITWTNRLGYDTNEVAGFDNRYSYRTGLSLSHQITPYLRGTAGVSYFYSDFKGGLLPGIDENSIAASLALSIQILENTNLNAGYYYYNYNSDLDLRDYDRHRLSLGISATF